MKVCLDFNGVIADTVQGLVNALKHDAGIKVPSRSFSKELVGTVFPNMVPGGRPKRLTQKLYRTVKHRVFDTEAFLEVPPVAGAKDGILALVGAGCAIVIVTDANSVTRARLRAWLARHIASDLKADIVLTRKCRSKEPHQACCDVVVDNEVAQLVPLVTHEKGAPRLVHFLPDRGTAGCDVALESHEPRIPSLRGWGEVLDYLQTCQEEQRQAA